MKNKNILLYSKKFKELKGKLIISSSIFLIIFSIAIYTQKSGLYIFETGRKSPEISIHSMSKMGEKYGKVVAASCGFTLHNGADEFTSCTTSYDCGTYTIPVAGTQQCGGVCNPTTIPTCTAQCTEEAAQTQSLSCPIGQVGSITQSRTSSCPSPTGSLVWGEWVTTSNTCVNQDFCTAGITPNVTYINTNSFVNGSYIYLNNSKVQPQYSLGTCQNPIPDGYKRLCEITRTTSDGQGNLAIVEDYDITHTTWLNETNKVHPYNESLTVRCGYYTNAGASNGVISNFVTSEAIVAHPNYNLPCNSTNACGQTDNGIYNINGICIVNTPAVPSCSITNVCGQVFPGYMCPTGCTLQQSVGELNNSCITDFTLTTDTVNPNGSVEFSWTTENMTSNGSNNTNGTPDNPGDNTAPGIIPNCSFVDLTTNIPRAVPGLQNLSPQTDKVRITNIQQSTRFCLVCKFYSVLNPSLLLGEAAKHQWVRVQRIGEN